MTAVLSLRTAADPTLGPDDVHAVLRRSILADGFDFVLDVDRSAGSYLVDARTGERYLDMFTFFASSALGMNHPALADDPDFRRRTRGRGRQQAEQLGRLQRADGPLRRHLQARARRSCAAPSVLRRRRCARRGERAQGRLRLEEPAQRVPRHGSRARHQGAAPARRVPRPQWLHAVADQHRPEQGGAVPEVRLAAHRRAVPSPRSRHGRARGRVAAAGPRGVRGEPARHRVLHRRADPGRGRRPAHPAASSSPRCASCATSSTRC